MGHFDGAVRDAVHALKYDGMRRVAEPLGDLLAGLIEDSGQVPDLVVGIPLSSQRLAERGYNQAGLIAHRVAERLGVPDELEAVTRVKNTASQVDLSAAERQENVKDAFRAEPGQVAGRRVLVIDDVLTTGSTMSACAEALRLAGASQIFGGAIGGAGHGMDR
ncbi:MAG TPA: ComF family protein [Aggregatilinea sp.]|uniref:ComF family protein n=1 Tax=Aggregatilinea sp. TaxID=2806333 RepID=UPI002C3BF81D|nr:ComF family protein [Aggregatilinea sp.]HML20052.1 ComF family protein [Aggregatilinea sp.]